MTKRQIILQQATEKFPGQKLQLQAFGGEYQLLVGEEAEECYAVVELEGYPCQTFDFERRD